MAVLDLYSRRLRRVAGGGGDVFAYDSIPNSLRVQILEIIGDALDEVVLKPIRARGGLTVSFSGNAKNLIAACVDGGLFPTYSSSQLSISRSLLESGIPTVGNGAAGHGQGVAPIEVPESLARCGLDLTATAILLAIESDE